MRCLYQIFISVPDRYDVEVLRYPVMKSDNFIEQDEYEMRRTQGKS